MSKRKKLISISGIIIIVLFLLIGFIRQIYVLPILMYHSLGVSVPEGNKLVVSVDTFERQMRFLKGHNYNVLTLEAAGDLIRNKKKIPARPVVLTFDDGYKDNYIHLFGVLKKYNFPATIFIIFSEVGRPDRLSEKEIKEMRDCGLITFGSHTISHPFLEHLDSDEELKKEISASKTLLEEKLGKPVNLFAYPFGRFNTKARQFVIDAGYKIAVATNPGKTYPDNDVFAFKRIRISEKDNNLFIFWLKTSGYYNFIRQLRHK